MNIKIPLRAVIFTFAAFFIFAVLAAPSPAGEKADDNFAECMKDGKKALQAGDYDEAEECFEEALGEKKDSAEALENLLQTFLETGRYSSAAKRGLESANARCLTLAGEALATTGKYKEAITAFEKALKIDKKYLRAQVDIAEVLIETGEKKRADKYLEEATDQALESDEHPADDLVSIARACILVNEYPDANNYFSMANATNMKYTELYVPWAYMYLEKYNYPDAKRTFGELLRMNPRHADALVGMAYGLLCTQSLGNRRFEQAKKTAEKALETNPKSFNARMLIGYVYFVEENHKDAVKTLEKALKINPNSTDALALIAAVYYFEGNTGKFNEMKGRAFKVNKKNARFYDGLSGIVDQRYLYKEAREFALKALEIDNESWSSYYHAGINIARTGDIKKARPYLEKSFEHDPFNVRCHNTLKIFDVLEKDFKEYKFDIPTGPLGNESFILRLNKDYADVFYPLYKEELERVIPELSKKYGYLPKGPYYCEVFDKQDYFAGRTIGLPDMPALGVCFGTFVVLDSPIAMRFREVWAATLRHEFAHTITLCKTNFRIPRWFTEGISVHEEKCGRPEWNREYELQFFTALKQGKALSVKEINRGFHRPKDFGEVILVYYESHLMIEFMLEKWGQKAINKLLEGYRDLKDTKQNFNDVLDVTLEEFDKQFFAYCEKLFGKYRIKAPLTRGDVRRLKEQIEDNEKTAAVYAELARAYMDIGRTEDAKIYMHRCRRIDPGYADIIILAGRMAFLEENIAEAVRLFRKALKTAPKYPGTDTYTAHRNLAMIFIKQKNHKAATEHLLAMKSAFNHEPSTYKALYKAYEELGEKDKAFKILEELVTFSHTDMNSRLVLAKKYHEDKNREKLARMVKEILYINPLVGAPYFYRGEILRAEKNYKDAMKPYLTAEKLSGRARGAAEMLGKIYAALAECHRKTGDDKKAKEYEELLKKIPPPRKPPENKPHLD